MVKIPKLTRMVAEGLIPIKQTAAYNRFTKPDGTVREAEVYCGGVESSQGTRKRQ